ncbi:hypothetical protein ES288_D08G033800v1 [Gossypium darwinii]|uniref:Alpha-carbonic anhydrase domain-containing protein n=1 Tax=Gossypium darwinii TaxID=34276 RepID=A0A5D2BIE1_GOSDA|nr:hypothetical protein ES288_D08G033800v1 [Gossypium darwinii]
MRGKKKGPKQWGDLKKEWAACKNGDLQSPIDLSNHRVKVIKKTGRYTSLLIQL